MGGEIGAESTVGEGSVFWIELHSTHAPRLVAVATEPTAAVPSRAHFDAPLHTLLCVEDNPANLLLVEKLLERRPDIRLLVAKDGIRGIEIARTARPDVILMDINLPGISGLVALSILAEDAETAEHSGDCLECQRHARRHRERHGGGLLPLRDQTDQGARVHGYAG